VDGEVDGVVDGVVGTNGLYLLGSTWKEKGVEAKRNLGTEN